MEVQNYIDDTGHYRRRLWAPGVETPPWKRFLKLERTDYYLWDLYVKVYDRDDESRNRRRKSTAHGRGALSGKGLRRDRFLGVLSPPRRWHAWESVTMSFPESDIIRLRFWESASSFSRRAALSPTGPKGPTRVAGSWRSSKMVRTGEGDRQIQRSHHLRG